MKIHTLWLVVAGGIICGIILNTGCATAKAKREWLSMFFDGVPKEGDPPKVRRRQYVDRAKVYDSTWVNQLIARVAPPTVMHPPYRNRQCDACHESGFSNKLRGPLLEVCFVCHQNFLEKAKFRHAPAGAGDCLTCHNPHQTIEQRLLTRKGQQLCLECHEPSEMLQVKAHANIGDAVCFTCHDPHGADNGKFLKSLAAVSVVPAMRAVPNASDARVSTPQ